MLDSSSSVLKNNKRSKQPRNAAQKDWSNTIGVYNSIYRATTESSQSIIPSVSSQTQLSAQPVGIVVNPVVQQGGTAVPAATTMLLNIGGEGSHSQPIIITQPLQFVQVNQLPLQAVAASGFLPVNSIATQSPVTSSSAEQTLPVSIAPTPKVEE